jgi:hypothetical protein
VHESMLKSKYGLTRMYLEKHGVPYDNYNHDWMIAVLEDDG